MGLTSGCLTSIVPLFNITFNTFHTFGQDPACNLFSMAFPTFFLLTLNLVLLPFITPTVVHAFESKEPPKNLSYVTSPFLVCTTRENTTTLNPNDRRGLPFNVSISGFSGENITSLIPTHYHHLTNDIPSITKHQLTSAYAIHHCPDDFRFVSSRCIRKHGPQAWSVSCKDDKSPSTWSVHYGICDPLQFCTDLPKSKVQGATALCLDYFDLRTSGENDTRNMNIMENIGSPIEVAVQLEIAVTSRDARSMLPAEGIQVWEEVVYTPGGALSRNASTPGEGHCSDCSSLMVSGIGRHSRRVNVKVQLPQANQDARIFLITTSSSEAR